MTAFGIGYAGDFTVNDDGTVGNNASVLRDGSGTILLGILHPADDLTILATVPGVKLTIDLVDGFNAATFTLGNLTNAAQSFDTLFMDRVSTTATATLVSNGAITESGSDAGADVIAGTLLASAVTGIGTSLNALETQAAVIEAETATGGINISNVGLVVIGGSTAELNGLAVLTSGDLRLTTIGSIVLADTTGSDTVSGGSVSGDVILTANGFDSDITSVVDQGAILANGGDVLLTAGRDIAFGTAGSDFGNDVRAHGSIIVNAGRDFILDGFADFVADSTPATTGGNAVITAGRNISLLNATGTSAGISVAGPGGGDVILTTGAGGILTLNAPSSNALNSTSGDVIVNADRIAIAGTSGIEADLSQVILRTVTPGREINLGGADTAVVLGLTDAELDRIFSPSLTIGGTSGGPITVSAGITPASVANLTLLTRETIMVGGNVSVAGALVLNAGDDVLLDNIALAATSISVFVDQAGGDGNIGGIANLAQLNNLTTMTITGNADADTLIGHAGSDTLNGLGGADTINGRDGNDILAGGGGADALDGGAGNDTFNLTNEATGVDTITDASGTDTILSTITRSLFDYTMIENLTLQGSAQINGVGNNGNNVLTGNSAVNALNGGAGNDTLSGGGGADILNGGANNDTYHLVADTSDTITDASGVDTVTSTITRSLAGFTTIENLSLVGVANINGTGNGLANLLVGNTGKNVLNGGANNDTLRGGLGQDSLFGEAGNDRFQFLAVGDSAVGATRDIIYDLDDAGNDQIDLSLMAGVTTFIGTNAFANAGEVRIQQAGANVLVQINTIGTGTAESEILIAGATIGVGAGQVDAGDFLL